MVTPRRALSIAATALAGVAFALLLESSSPESSATAPPPRAMRAFELHSMRPDLSRAEGIAVLDQSDALVARLHEEGVDDVATELRTRLSDTQPTEAQRRAWFQANRHLFGDRTYEQSAWSVDQLVRIHLVRQDLGITRLTPYYGAAPAPVELPP